MDALPIISTHDLARLLTSSTPRVIDCRFNLSDPNWGHDNYLQGHIPGALYAHLNHDLSGPIGSETGRHPLPAVDFFLRRLNDWRISSETQVIVYDTAGGAYAARMWFMLRAIGHERVQVLDGGFPKWQADGYPIRSGLENISLMETSSISAAQFDPHMVAATPEIELAVRIPSILLIDARASERFQGLQEPIDPVAGHIPGAVNRFHGNNLTAEGVFKPKEVLREEYFNLLRKYPASQVVVYCGSGVTSCHHLIAMELAGLAGARLYAGSWSEWIRNPSRPIAIGAG